MFSRNTRAIQTVFRRHNSSHHAAPEKSIEVNLTKIFAVAAVLGGFYVYRNHERTDKPLVATKLYDQVKDGQRAELRHDAYQKRYDVSFLKSLIRDKGGIGQKQYRRQTDTTAVPTNLIPTHSPYGNQFGAGIKTEGLGPRKERIRVYAETA